MLSIQVIYKAPTANNRGRFLRTRERPIARYDELPVNNMLAVSLRAQDGNGVWQPVRQMHSVDHIALIRFRRDLTTYWDLHGWDDGDVDPIDPSDPFADRSAGPRFPMPYRGVVDWFDGVQLDSQDDWDAVLAEISERQREPAD